MISARNRISLTLALLFFCSPSSAVQIVEMTGYLYTPDISTTSIQDIQISPYGSFSSPDFAGNGLEISFDNSLDADNFGTFSWTITNTGETLSNLRFFGFLDTDIDNAINGFFNEYGDESGFAPGLGSIDSNADYWEIDEPGLLFGNIIDNLFAGSLDNFNNVPQGLEEDVSLALGFEIGELQTNDSLTVIFNIDTANNGGLLHFDPDSNTGYYFNGSATVQVATVPAPGALGLFLSGMVGLLLRRKNSNSISNMH